MTKLIVQGYPRLTGSGLLDDSSLVPHKIKPTIDKLKGIIVQAISIAERKSSRAILNLPEDALDEQIDKTYKKEGRELFRYFIKYCGDPASSAYQFVGMKCSDVAQEQFRNRTLQKERMNSAWRYQYIAKDAAIASKRFKSVSDVGLAEADFNAVIKYNGNASFLTIYTSIKNRSNTMGGQDWPKAIAALEAEASTDKNRVGDYICVFGITIEHGQRRIRGNQKNKNPYSPNTELWFSDFFWPFFSNYSYEEIATLVLDVLIASKGLNFREGNEVPEELLKSFEDSCRDFDLLDSKGYFNDAYKLVKLFCQKSVIISSSRRTKNGYRTK
jgi:hypothetical protein